MGSIWNGPLYEVSCHIRRRKVKLQSVFTDVAHIYHFFIGIYISWLDSEPDKFEVVGSSPTMPTNERKLMRSFITKLMLFEVMLKAYPQICE